MNFRPKCIDYAISLAPTTRKPTRNPFADWPAAELSRTPNSALLELGKRGFAVGSDAGFEKFRHYAQALHKRMLGDPGASPVALAIVGVVANYAVPTKPGRRSRVLARQSAHPIRNILLGVAGGAFGGL